MEKILQRSREKKIGLTAMGIQETESIKKDILDTRCWIKRIIASVETDEQLEGAKRIVNNWSKLMYSRIDNFKPFFFRSSSGWRSSLELYLRINKELESHLAAKKTKMRFMKMEEMYA